MTDLPLVGIFAGGAASRMGGAPKGLLPAPGSGEPLVVRLARIVEEAGLRCALVGATPAYVEALPALPVIVDEPAGIGPLGGLRALLHAAGAAPAIALSCDLPFVDGALLARLAAAPPAPVVAPRDEKGWQPFFARYRRADVLPVLDRLVASGARSFRALFEELAVAELPLSPDESSLLADWDSPSDIAVSIVGGRLR